MVAKDKARKDGKDSQENPIGQAKGSAKLLKFLQGILDHVADPVFVKDRNHKWVVLNDRLCSFMGYPRQELIGKTDYDYFPKNEADVFWEKDEEVFETGRENINEEDFTDVKGVTHTIVTKKNLFIDADKNPYIVGVIRDETEKKSLINELKHSKERLEEKVAERTKELERSYENLKSSRQTLNLALDVANEGLFDINLDVDKSYFSPRYYTMLGYTPYEFTPGVSSWEKLVHPDDVRQAKKKLAKYLKNPVGEYESEYRMLTKEGDYRWILSKGQTIDSGIAGDGRHFIGIHTDITDLKDRALTLDAIVKTAPTGIIVTKDAVIQRVSDMACKIFGYEMEDLVGNNIEVLFKNKSAHKRFRKRVLDGIQGGHTFSQDVELFTKVDKKIDVFVNSTYLDKDVKKEVCHTMLDITSRKIARLELEKSEKKFRDLVESSPDGVVVHHKGMLMYCNPSAIRMLGFESLDELIGLSVMDFVHPEDRSLVVSRIKKIQKGMKMPTQHERFIKKDGSILDVEVLGMPVEYEGLMCNQVIFRDISERLNFQKAIVESEEKYRTLAESSKSLIFTLDDELRLTYINSYGVERMGVPAKKMMGSTVKDLFPKDVGDRKFNNLRKTLKSRKPLHFENISYLNGEKIWLDTWFIPLRDKDGNYTKIMGVSTDISSIKDLQNELMLKEFSLNNSSISLFWVTKDAQIFDFNSGFCKLLGYTSKKLASMRLFEIDSNLDTKSWSRRWKNISKIKSARAELSFTRKDGTTVPVMVSANYLVHEALELVFVQAVDISERKKNERNLITLGRTSNELLELRSDENIFKHLGQTTKEIMGDCIVVVSEFGRANRSMAVRSIIGLDKKKSRFVEKVLGMRAEEVVVGNLKPNVIRRMSQNQMQYKKNGLYGLVYNLFSEKMCETIESALGIKKVVLGTLKREGTLYGTIAVLSKSKKFNEPLFTAFLTQASIALSARYENEKLISTEKRYHTTIDSLKDLLHVVDENLDIVLANKHLLRWNKKFGLGSDVVGKNIRDVYPFLTDEVINQYLQVFEAGKPLTTEEKIEVKGKTFITDTRKIPIVENKKVVQVITIIRDITKRRLAEKEVQVVKSHLETVLDGISESIVVLDKNYDIISFNKAFEKWVGKKKTFIVGEKCYEVIHSRDKSCRQCVIRDVFRTKKMSESVHYHNTRNGRVYHETRAYPIKRAGKVEAAIYIFRDVTEKERMKDRLKQNYEQLLKVNKELLKLDKLKTEFMAIASHELKTPLAIINGYSDLLISQSLGKLNDVQKEKVKRIKANTNHLSDLVGNILDLARIESGDIHLNVSDTEVNELVDEIVSDFHQISVEKNISLKKEVVKGLKIKADRSLLKQLIVNLLDNAFKFTPRGKTITVKAAAARDKVVLKIIDNGQGMPKKEMANIFKRFYQVDATVKRKHGGAGLGLAIVESIVNLHGWKIDVQSQLNKGTVFSITIPKR